jgi:thiamine biosynthesis lipoprotein
VRRGTITLLTVLALALALRFWLTLADEPTAILQFARPLMGTLWTIDVVHHGRPTEAQAAVESAFEEIDRIEKAMSEWLPDSPVAMINAAAGRYPVEVSDELAAILQRSLDYSVRSEGAFDITWRGMGVIWRFDDTFAIPTPENIERGRRNVDYRALRLEGNSVFLTRGGMSIGLGGIAKGYAVDRAAQILRASGFPDSLVAGAGDILASGTKGGLPWIVGVQHPRRQRGVLLGTLPLSGAAISTSGDYERFRIVDGVRYHHIIDARTGWPAHESISVSVVAPTAEQSDALATTIFVLGPEKGLALAQAAGVDVLVIDAGGSRHATGVFKTHIQREGSQ